MKTRLSRHCHSRKHRICYGNLINEDRAWRPLRVFTGYCTRSRARAGIRVPGNSVYLRPTRSTNNVEASVPVPQLASPPQQAGISIPSVGLAPNTVVGDIRDTSLLAMPCCGTPEIKPIRTSPTAAGSE